MILNFFTPRRRPQQPATGGSRQGGRWPGTPLGPQILTLIFDGFWMSLAPRTRGNRFPVSKSPSLTNGASIASNLIVVFKKIKKKVKCFFSFSSFSISPWSPIESRLVQWLEAGSGDESGQIFIKNGGHLTCFMMCWSSTPPTVHGFLVFLIGCWGRTALGRVQWQSTWNSASFGGTIVLNGWKLIGLIGV